MLNSFISLAIFISLNNLAHLWTAHMRAEAYQSYQQATAPRTFPNTAFLSRPVFTRTRSQARQMHQDYTRSNLPVSKVVTGGPEASWHGGESDRSCRSADDASRSVLSARRRPTVADLTYVGF